MGSLNVPCLTLRSSLSYETNSLHLNSTWRKLRECRCLVVKLCLTLLWHHSLLGSSIHGISQERIVGWAAISFSRGSFQLRDQTCISCIDRQILYYWDTRKSKLREFCWCSVAQSCPTLYDPTDCRMPGFPVLHHFPWVSSCPLSQWCHPTISSSVIPFSGLQSFPASGSFLMKRDYLKGFLFSRKDLDLYWT